MKIRRQFRFYHFPRLPVLLLLCSFFWFHAPDVWAGSRCAQCGREIKGRYLKAAGKVYCSRKCFDQTLPRCAACGKLCRGGYSKDGKHFCSKACLATTFPRCSGCGKRVSGGALVTDLMGKEHFFCIDCTRGEPCFCCGMPRPEGKLDDGRFICAGCSRTAVMDPAKMKSIVAEIRELMKSRLELETDHRIDLLLVDQKELKTRTAAKGQGMELGLYSYEKQTERTTRTKTNLFGKVVSKTSDEKVQESFSIRFLYGLPESKLREVAAHELAHDWMQKFYPGIEDHVIKEGWAEYVASLVNIELGQAEMNRRMENNKDPVYGGGYRKISAIAREHGRDGLFRLFRETEAKR